MSLKHNLPHLGRNDHLDAKYARVRQSANHSLLIPILHVHVHEEASSEEHCHKETHIRINIVNILVAFHLIIRQRTLVLDINAGRLLIASRISIGVCQIYIMV